MRPYERGWILNPSTHLKNKQNRRGYAPVTPRWVGRDRGIPGLAGQVQWETFSDTKVDCSWGRHPTPVYDLHMHVHPGANTYICVHTHHSIRNNVISAISPTAYLPGNHWTSHTRKRKGCRCGRCTPVIPAPRIRRPGTASSSATCQIWGLTALHKPNPKQNNPKNRLRSWVQTLADRRISSLYVFMGGSRH